MTTDAADASLDCRGLSCPMPIVKITQQVKAMAPGQTLEVQATDLAFQLDLEAWARRTGNEIVSFEPGQDQRAVIRVTP